MKKVNVDSIQEEEWITPGRKFVNYSRGISLTLGRDPQSHDLKSRHPFDVEICRIPAGTSNCPYHSHSAQWEYYHVIAGRGSVRHQDGMTDIETGDAFIFQPGEPHQLINNSNTDLVVYIVADNPLGESCYYPDSKKWLVSSPERRVIRSEPLDYLDGEE